MSESTAEKLITSPHTHAHGSVSAVMQQVLFALIPGILLSIYYFGIGILIHLLLAIIFALLFESGVLKLRKQIITPVIKDGTAIVTAVLFALTISPYTPWWVSFFGMAFAIIVAKHLYGGLGNNPFNPAMAGYIFVLLCFPVQMAYWPDITLNESTLSMSQKAGIIFNGLPQVLDGISGATPLGHMKVELNQMTMVSEIKTNPLYGSLGGKAWEWINMAYIAGGIWLLLNKIIRWQIPVAVISGLFIISFLFGFIDSDIYPPTLFNLFSGGTMLCAFFIATDPASSSTSPLGKIIYGAGIGILIYIIRTWSSYPDGVAFAVLIMNAMVPLIDYYTRPKVLGEQ